MSKFKVVVDKEKCIGCGTCVAMCPDNFVLDGDKAKPVKEEVDDVTCVVDAVPSCPTQAISTEEEK